jgi:hypothetical protein
VFQIDEELKGHKKRSRHVGAEEKENVIQFAEKNKRMFLDIDFILR